MFFVTPAHAQAGPAGEPSILMTVMPFILIFIIMYFLLIRPNQKRMKEHQAMIAAVKKGDRIVTAGGILGKVTGIGAEGTDEITAEIAPNTRVTILRSTITAVLSKTQPANDAGK